MGDNMINVYVVHFYNFDKGIYDDEEKIAIKKLFEYIEKNNIRTSNIINIQHYDDNHDGKSLTLLHSEPEK